MTKPKNESKGTYVPSPIAKGPPPQQRKKIDPQENWTKGQRLSYAVGFNEGYKKLALEINDIIGKDKDAMSVLIEICKHLVVILDEE